MPIVVVNASVFLVMWTEFSTVVVVGCCCCCCYCCTVDPSVLETSLLVVAYLSTVAVEVDTFVAAIQCDVLIHLK